MLKDAKRFTYSDLKGHCVLTPGQIRNLLKRMEPPRVDYERKTTDDRLLSAFKTLLQEEEPDLFRRVKEGVTEGIASPRVTKDFCHWDVTEAQMDGFLSEKEVQNFGYLRSYRYARKVLVKLVSPTHLKPVKIYRGMDTSVVWSNPDASAGAIGKGSKKDNETECFAAFERLKEGVKNSIPFENLQIPAIPAHRAQISGFYNSEDYDDFHYSDTVKWKDRLVWIIDGATTLFESQYANPIQNFLSKSVSWYAGGKEPEEIRSRMSLLSKSGITWISLDYSGYDQTVPARVIHDVFTDVIRPMFDECYWNELKFIEYNFIHTKMLLPRNTYVVKHRGIPSGSMFTQIIGSLCNALIGLTYLCSKYDASERETIDYVIRQITHPSHSKPMLSVMGDDNIWGLTRPVDIADWASYVDKIFNMKIHADKCATSSTMKYPEYLKRIYTPRGEKMNLLYLILNTCSPERGPRSYDGYSEWHILYGLFYTYRGTFNNPIRVEEFLIRKMSEYGELEALKALPTHELPGVLRGFSNKSRDNLFRRAKAVERYLTLPKVS